MELLWPIAHSALEEYASAPAGNVILRNCVPSRTRASAASFAALATWGSGPLRTKGSSMATRTHRVPRWRPCGKSKGGMGCASCRQPGCIGKGCEISGSQCERRQNGIGKQSGPLMAAALHQQIMQAISTICTREASGDVIGRLHGLGLIARKPLWQKAGADRFDAFSSRSLIFSGSGVSTLGAGSTLRRYRQRLRGKIRRRGR